MALGRSLFRQEAIEFQRGQREFGEIALLQPVSTKLLAWLLAAIVTIAIVFLCFAQFSRKQTVSGIKDALLPAWSIDGTRLAWVQKSGRKKYTSASSSISYALNASAADSDKTGATSSETPGPTTATTRQSGGRELRSDGPCGTGEGSGRVGSANCARRWRCSPCDGRLLLPWLSRLSAGAKRTERGAASLA